MEKIDRNATCPCGSGKKFRACCLLQINKAPRILARLSFPERFVLGRLLRKSDIFRKFYDSERPKIAKALCWVEEPGLPEGITGRETSDESGAHVIRLRRVPAAVRDGWLIAHELGHAVIDERGFPVTGVRDLRLEPLSSALNSMIHDPLVDAGLLSTYGLTSRRNSARKRRQFGEISRS